MGPSLAEGRRIATKNGVVAIVGAGKRLWSQKPKLHSWQAFGRFLITLVNASLLHGYKTLKTPQTAVLPTTGVRNAFCS